jgi:hypothetical protein
MYTELDVSSLPAPKKETTFWPRQFPSGSLYRLDVFKPISTIDIITDAQTGAITGFKEVPTETSESTPQRSTALNRQPGSLEDFHR